MLLSVESHHNFAGVGIFSKKFNKWRKHIIDHSYRDMVSVRKILEAVLSCGNRSDLNVLQIEFLPVEFQLITPRIVFAFRIDQNSVDRRRFDTIFRVTYKLIYNREVVELEPDIRFLLVTQGGTFALEGQHA